MTTTIESATREAGDTEERLPFMRCHRCRTPYAQGEIGPGSVLKVKCKKCKYVNYVLVADTA